MNILLITWNFPPKVGGLENVIYNVWRGLCSFHTVFTITAHSKQKDETLDKVYRPFLPQLPFYMLYAFIKGAVILARKKIDVIFAGSALTSCIAVTLGRIFGKKVITHVFGLDVIYPSPAYQFLVRAFLPRNDAIISISRPAKDELIKRNTPSEKIWIIHPGIDTGLFNKDFSQERLKEKYGFANKLVLLSVCRLAKRKGIAEFISNSLPKIIKQAPEVMYAVVGQNPKESLAHHKDDYLKEIEKAINNKGLKNNVKLFGNVEQEVLIELYYLCDLFLLPVIPFKNDVEGFGVTFIEANAAGKPVIGTNIGGIPEAIENGKSGIVVEPGDFEALSKEIISLLKDKSKRQEIGNYAKNRAVDKFDWDIVIRDYLKLLEALTQG